MCVQIPFILICSYPFHPYGQYPNIGTSGGTSGTTRATSPIHITDYNPSQVFLHFSTVPQQSSVGLEPTASRLTVPRSSQLSYEDTTTVKSLAHPHSPLPPPTQLTLPPNFKFPSYSLLQQLHIRFPPLSILHLQSSAPIGSIVTHTSLQNTSTSPPASNRPYRLPLTIQFDYWS